MNAQLKTILLTVATLSLFAIALVELSGVSRTALFNRFSIEDHHRAHAHEETESVKEKIAQLPKTEIRFEETMHQFGKIKEGTVARHDFKFTNIGDHPLIIFKTDASCGCTVPSYPKEPIAPGGTGTITVEFNSKGRPGHQKKMLIIHSNAQQEALSIGFEAEVES